MFNSIYSDIIITHVHLGGDSKPLLVEKFPHENCIGETLCSMNFSSRVRGLELYPTWRQQDVSEVFNYKFCVLLAFVFKTFSFHQHTIG